MLLVAPKEALEQALTIGLNDDEIVTSQQQVLLFIADAVLCCSASQAHIATRAVGSSLWACQKVLFILICIAAIPAVIDYHAQPSELSLSIGVKPAIVLQAETSHIAFRVANLHY